MTNTTAAQFPSLLNSGSTGVETAATVGFKLAQTIPPVDAQYVVPSASTGLNLNDVRSTSLFAITAVGTGAGGTFTIAGNYTGFFVPGVNFTIKSSTNNNGSWTVASSAYSAPSTVITVIASQTVGATADGSIVPVVTGRDAGTRLTYDNSVPTKLLSSNGADNWFGYVKGTLGSIAANAADPSTANAGFAKGYQIYSVNESVQNPTGLANDATVYTATVLVDGSRTISISVTGSAAQTPANLINEINADLGAYATATLESSVGIRITSSKGYGTSIVQITDGTTNPLFNTLTYSVSHGLQDSVKGFAAMDAMTVNKIDGNSNNVVAMAVNKATFDTPVLALTGAYTPA